MSASMRPALRTFDPLLPALACGEPSPRNAQFNGQAKLSPLSRGRYERLLARSADGGLVSWLASGCTLLARRSHKPGARPGCLFGKPLPSLT